MASTHFLLPKTTMSGSNSCPGSQEAEIAAYLESLLQEIKDAINSGEWDGVRRHFSPDFMCEPVFRPSLNSPEGTVASLVGLEEYIGMCRGVLPGMKTEIANLVTDVDLKHGRAAVFTTFRTVGLPEGVVRHSVGRFQWRKIHGQWLCTSHMSARGMEVE